MYALQIDHLCKTYKNGVTALKGIDLRVEQGEFFALLGPNGAGKSTTLGILCSLIRKTSGKVKIMGADLDLQPSLAKSHIGVVPQEFNFNVFEPALEIVINQAGYYGIPRAAAIQRAHDCLHKLGLWEKRFTIPRELSGGMKRRLMIARAIVHQPRILVLDEPTAGVDIEIRRLMWDFLIELNEAGTTIILTTHYLEEAERLCQRIAIINQGQIVEDSNTQQLLSTLACETLVLDLEQNVLQAPSIPGFSLRLIHPQMLEVDIPKDLSLNPLFEALSQQNISIRSLRNKSNRLEEVFISLVNHESTEPEIT